LFSSSSEFKNASINNFEDDNVFSDSVLFNERIRREHWTMRDFNDTDLQEIINNAMARKTRLAIREPGSNLNITWPIKQIAEVPGNIILGGLMMIHEREDKQICGPIMPQGGIQALECMLHTLDWINSQDNFLPDITLGAYVLDDCDKDTYGLEQAVDFIKGKYTIGKCC
jgi:hypothetical protein